MDRLRIYMSFDLSHDADLKQRMMTEAASSSAVFEILGHSEGAQISAAWTERVRKRIGAADEMIVICGAHTQDSLQVAAEIGIAQQESRPYFLLWGRRNAMCTKPAGAKPTDGMYSWTPSIISEQLALTLRLAQSRSLSNRFRRVARPAQAPRIGPAAQ